MIEPSDRQQRQRFIGDLEQNFSVVAAAGSGKTRAITDRIVALATSSQGLDWLPRLLVVTYTNRAASEMQHRARQSIIEAKLRPEILTAFNRAFFGTIHSLCTKLLRQHGHHLGLPGQLDHLDEASDAALWTDFIQQETTIRGTLDAIQRRLLLRLVPAQKLMELGRRTSEMHSAPPPGPFPVVDFHEIYAFAPNKQSLAAVTRSRDALQRWERAWQGEGFAGLLPACESKPLRPIWESAIAPLREWIQKASLHVAAETGQRYRDFRLHHGAMTFNDQVALASALLRHPEAGARIRQKGHRVILDEAQDTDPAQFDVLLQIARPPEAEGDWLDNSLYPPRPGHFCMVGDFQQSIFGGRADLSHYRRIHRQLQECGAGEALEFSVTFRLDEANIGFVNAALPGVLHGADQQVAYVRLNPRPQILGGQVARFQPEPPPPEGSGWKDWQKARWEAGQLAIWLRNQGLEKLRASSWSEVAILCPRTRWLPVLSAALRQQGLAAQVQSERAIKGDNPAYAWFTALTIVLAEPRNGYEIVGVLREVFGISDQDLASFAQGYGDRFHLTGPTSRPGVVAETLNMLVRLRDETRTQPLFATMQNMVRTTHLRERLLTLPTDIYEGMERELANLLTQAATAEAEGATLEAFAADLRDGFNATREVKATASNAVQMISGHKAKGSEWDAVIVPFFGRQVVMRSPLYPRILRHPHTRESLAALDSGDVDEDWKSALDLQAKQEMERVLYVALTRARHTLVLVDDRNLFTGKSGLPKNAQARLLRFASGDSQASILEDLPDTISACAITATSQSAKTSTRSQTGVFPPLSPCAPSTGEQGRERAAFFVKRNPSAMAEAASAIADPTAAAPSVERPSLTPNSGQRYGTWWHGFVERLDWAAGNADWEEVFRSTLPDSPDPERSLKEWGLLQTALAKGGALNSLLTDSGTIAHVEVPFLWAMSERECLDGIMDLVIHNPSTGATLILDWKTNRTSSKELPDLANHYLPQLSAYWEAATRMLGGKVSAGIYSTMTGRWIPYAAADLASSWERLKAAPQELERVLEEADDRPFGAPTQAQFAFQ